MNIVQMPAPYPDELLYSVFARFYAHSGYLTYRSVAEILFENFRGQPNMDFVNRLRKEVQAILCLNCSWEHIVMEHTMLPYYCRFLDVDRRRKAYQAVIDMTGTFSEMLGIPKQRGGIKSFLRYCPLCSGEDRKQYGETYWHRIHQIDGLTVCAIHGCRLHNSSVLRRGKDTPALYTADEHTSIAEISMGYEIERHLAQYIFKCFELPIMMDNDVDIGEYLLTRMEEKKYVSLRGEQRRVTKFINDFQSFYAMLQENQREILSPWKLEKILKGYRRNPLEIFQIAFFLDVANEELVNPVLPLNRESKLFENTVKSKIIAGNSMRKVAKDMGVSRRSVQLACNQLNIHSKYQKLEGTKLIEWNRKIKEKREYWLCVIRDNPNKSFTQLCAYPVHRKHLVWLRRNDKEWTDNHWPQKEAVKFHRADWEKIDLDTLPLVEGAIRELIGNAEKRPRQVTKYAIAKILHLPDKRLDLLPQCTKFILEYTETKESYWANEIVWAIRYMLRNGVVMNYKHLRSLTNMRKSNFFRAYNNLCQIGDEKVIDYFKKIMDMDES